jgi:ubiquinone/menaquinone biosynthesis C-methylase UbiE
MNHDLSQSVRNSYDRLADEYARRVFHELDNKPFDRQMLDRFAAETASQGTVCDMGCGPGHVGRYLCEAGAHVFGLDLSPQMLEQARQLNPGMAFQEGNMMALELEANSLAGITAFYAIVNIPEESLPAVFQEMHRVLQPGGLLLLAFHVGSEVIRIDELWGQPISMDFFMFSTAAIRRLLQSSGFTIEEVLEREPYAPEVEHQSHRAYIFARKSAAGTEI